MIRSYMKFHRNPTIFIMSVCTGLLMAAVSNAICIASDGIEAKSIKRALLYQDDFENDLSQWVIEQMPGGRTSLMDGMLDIDDSTGCTVWFKEKLEAPVCIEYMATVIQADGPNDRVSDLNCFWMAIDPEHPEDIFQKSKERGGRFQNYHSLRLYYVGYGANNNTTTRFRRYPGDGSRPMLPEHDLTQNTFMLTPNTPLNIQIIVIGNRTQYSLNGNLIFDIRDEYPFSDGWFGFRTVQNHLKIDNFRVYRLMQEEDD